MRLRRTRLRAGGRCRGRRSGLPLRTPAPVLGRGCRQSAGSRRGPGRWVSGRARLSAKAGPEPRRGHRGRGVRRGSPLVVELGEVGGEDRSAPEYARRVSEPAASATLLHLPPSLASRPRCARTRRRREIGMSPRPCAPHTVATWPSPPTRRPRGLVSSWSTKIAGPRFMNSQLKDDGQCAAPPARLQRRQRGRIVDVRPAELAAVLSDVRSAARPMRRVRVALERGLRGRTTGGDRG